MTLEQYNRAKETEIYRHELELEMQRRRKYLEMCKMMEEYNQRYFHFHSLPTKPILTQSMTCRSEKICVKSKLGKTADNHIPRDINEWLHERTHDLGEYTK